MARYIFAAILTMLAGAAFFMYTKPTYDGVQGLKAQGEQYDAALEKASELQKLKQSLLEKYNSFTQSDRDRILKMLPDHVDNVALILDLDNLAAKFKMPIANVDVSTPASAGTTAGAIGPASSLQKYDSVTIKFSTAGTYEDFLALLKDLESALRVVDLVSLSLTPGGGGLGANAAYYTYDVTLRTYWLK